MNLEPFYFELQSLIGVTNHMGGLEATTELAESCHITPDKHVLDVGCGIGATSCFIAKTYNCTVIGVDIREEMVTRSRERARKEGVQNIVEFQVADAQHLPFQDNLFDAVISESVTAFLDDKQRAVAEYMRVITLGGYVGLNETTWIQPPPPELTAYFSRIMGVTPETPQGWKTLMKKSALDDITATPCKITYIRQFANEIKMMGLKEVFKPWGRLLFLYIKSPVYRRVIKDLMRESLNIPRNVFDYFGYGLYVGKK